MIQRLNSDVPDLLENSPIKYLQHADCHLAYQDIGCGPPVVLIMGIGGTMYEWDRTFLSALASTHRLILCDNRGIGNSCPDISDISIPAMAEDISCLVQALNLSSVHLFGYSMGSMVGMEIARRSPGIIASLILYATSLSGHDTTQRIEPFVDMALPEIIRIEALFPEEWLSVQNDPGSVFPAPVHPINGPVIMRQLSAIAQWEVPAPSLLSISVPVLVLVGDQDLITPLSEAKKVFRTFSHASCNIIVGGGHGAMYQQPEVIAGHALQFLSGISRKNEQ